MRALLITTILLATFSLSAQRNKDYYRFGLGLRAGVKSGMTLKLFATDHLAFESIIGFRNGNVDAMLLAERNFYPFKVESLSWYCGGGAHYTGSSDLNNWEGRTGVEYRAGRTAYGADIIAGFDFKFPVIPVAVSLDFKPFIEFSSLGGHITAFDAGIGIKFAL